MLDRWLTLVARVSNLYHPDVARGVFDDLVAHYTAMDRRYHDLHHIEACLALFDSVRELAPHPDSIELAIWFHDVIYDSRRGDNEEASAEWAGTVLARLGVPSSLKQSIRDLILVTRHNTPPVDPDAALIMDIDLSIWGQPVPVFDVYEMGVRFEYAWVPDPAYRIGRTKVLQSFLNRPRIYYTDYFYGTLESAARQNLTHSLAKLKAGER